MLVLTLRRRRREAKRVDLVAPPAPLPEIPPEIRSAVLKLRAEGKLISAVKLLRERIDVDAGWSGLADACGMRPTVPGEGFHAGKPIDRNDGTAVVHVALSRPRTGYSPIEASRLHHCIRGPVKDGLFGGWSLIMENTTSVVIWSAGHTTRFVTVCLSHV